MSADQAQPVVPLAYRSPPPPRRWWLPRLRAKHVPLLATLVVCTLLYASAAMRYDHFFSLQVFIDFFRGEKNASLGIAAVGLTFVILSGGIDLSVGSVIACTGIIVATLVERHGWHPWAAMPLALAIGAAFGFAMGLLIHVFRLAPFLVTLAGLFLARGIASVISLTSIAVSHQSFVALSEAQVELADVRIPLGAIVFAVIVVLAVLVAALTPFGRNVYAIGGDEHSAVLMGVPVGRTKVAIYTLSGFLSALAGVVYAASLSSGDVTAAAGWELDAIAAVVIGGTLLTGGVGSIWGTVIGVLILAIIQTAIMFEGRISSWWARIIIGALLAVFIALQKLLTRRTDAAH